jgi:hypothetical protein
MPFFLIYRNADNLYFGIYFDEQSSLHYGLYTSFKKRDVEEVLMKIIYSIFICFILLMNSFSKVNAQDELVPGEQDFMDNPNGDYGNEDSDIPNGVKLGKPTYIGTGCSEETARVVLSFDSKTLSLLFDHLETHAGGSLGKRTTLNCNLKVPIHVPAYFQTMVTRLDYRGYVFAPPQGRTVLRANYQVSSMNDNTPKNVMIKRRKLFTGPVNLNFTTTTRFRLNRFDLKCGESFFLNVGTQIVAVANQANQEAIIALDSIDQTANIQYSLKWKRCR